MRGSAILNGMKSSTGCQGPQIAFLKAEPRAARRGLPRTRPGHCKCNWDSGIVKDDEALSG
jgi:hypothetical protein